MQSNTADNHSRVFLKDIPVLGIGGRSFEEGIDTSKVRIPQEIKQYECVICNSVPRHPVFLPRCVHVHCDYCLTQYVMMKEIGVRNHEEDANGVLRCPQCNSNFDLDEIKDLEHVHPWIKDVWKHIISSCPYGCDLKGSLLEIDRHQAFYCPERPILCPNEGCLEVLPARKLEEEHFPTCAHYKSTCKKCLTPVLHAEFANHDCILSLKKYVSGM